MSEEEASPRDITQTLADLRELLIREVGDLGSTLDEDRTLGNIEAIVKVLRLMA